ncbi:MAG TPA: response regulator transcription factor [Gaiellaceae bacterium]|jgi:DNA-binding NarL/FixJ family response regulator
MAPPGHDDLPAVFLVDSWVSFRRSLRLFLEAAGYRVVGEADTAALAAGSQALRRTDVVVLEPAPDWPRLERQLSALRLDAPRAGIVLLGSDAVPVEVVFRAFERGVGAYVTKEDDPADLLRAVEAAHSREFVMFPRRLLQARETFRRPVSASLVEPGRPSMSKRELEILRLAAAARSNAEIAQLLWVTDQTVKFHLANVFRKLGVRSRAEAVAKAIRLGILGWEGGQPA